jgi:hypothetical protein
LTVASQRLAAARWLAETHRLKLFPLRRDSKLPAVKAFSDAATDDAAQHAKWWAKGERNLGVATGPSGLVVIDTDQKDGKDGLGALRALAGSHVADLDKTLVVESPTGSRHFYFRGAPVANSAGKLGIGVDVRSKGGLVVAPGSTIGGQPYHVVNSAPIADLPQWLVDAIAQSYLAQPTKLETTLAVELDTEAAIAAATVYLAADAPASIEGQGGNDTAYRVACRLKDLGASEFMAGALMFGAWNERCAPPWAEDELLEIVGNAYRYGENSVGVASPEIEFEDIPDEIAARIGLPEPAQRGRLSFLTDADIRLGKGERREYIIKGVLARGDLGAIFGKPGAGKSLIAPYIARMVTQGRAAFGQRTRQGGVFYVAAEDPTGMTERVAALQSRYGDGDGFVLVRGVSNLTDKASEDLKALFQEMKAKRPLLTFIDTLAMAFPGIDENSAEGMGRVVQVGRILARLGGAVIYIHHDTKAGGDTPRGHSVFDGALDMKLKLTRNETTGIVDGKLGKNRNGSLDCWAPAFRIAVADLGADEDGDRITAAYAEEIKAPVRRPRENMSVAARGAFSILVKLLDGAASAPLSAWRDKCCQSESEMSAAPEANSRRKAFRRALRELLERERVEVRDSRVMLAGGGEDFDTLEAGPFNDETVEA